MTEWLTLSKLWSFFKSEDERGPSYCEVQWVKAEKVPWKQVAFIPTEVVLPLLKWRLVWMYLSIYQRCLRGRFCLWWLTCLWGYSWVPEPMFSSFRIFVKLLGICSLGVSWAWGCWWFLVKSWLISALELKMPALSIMPECWWIQIACDFAKSSCILGELLNCHFIALKCFLLAYTGKLWRYRVGPDSFLSS